MQDADSSGSGHGADGLLWLRVDYFVSLGELGSHPPLSSITITTNGLCSHNTTPEHKASHHAGLASVVCETVGHARTPGAKMRKYECGGYEWSGGSECIKVHTHVASGRDAPPPALRRMRPQGPARRGWSRPRANHEAVSSLIAAQHARGRYGLARGRSEPRAISATASLLPPQWPPKSP